MNLIIHSKILCFLVFALYSLSCFSIVSEEKFKTHLRWSMTTSKDDIQVTKNGNIIQIKTLSDNIYNQIASDLSKFNIDKNYISKIEYIPSESQKKYTTKITLKDQSVELFSFYKEGDKKYIFDFWINKDLVSKKSLNSAKKIEAKLAKAKNLKKKKNKKRSTKKSKSISGPTKIKSKENSLNNTAKNKKFRDFRYGAAFMWNVDALIPRIEKDVDLEVKAPDYFYKVKNRDFTSSDKKESHMQLIINFYNEKKWGLMARSLELYNKKYGFDENRQLLDFIKATSIIKNSIKKRVSDKKVSSSPKAIMASAINLLQSVSESAKDYALKMACLRYILQYNLNKKDYIQSLQTAKKIYVLATEEFDDDMITKSSSAILYSLAKLKQVEKLKSFLSNKAVIRVLPAQLGLAYKSYIQLKNKNIEKIIDDYNINESSYTKPVHSSILYNTAEAYFRQGKYKKAISLFDQFLSSYSHLDAAGFAYVRIALSYDLLDKNPKKVQKLYELAINRASNPKARVEAKIRYVGQRLCRKKELYKEDLEVESFLSLTEVEKKALNKKLRQLLWFVRLRVLINKKDFDSALAYLNSIPLENFTLTERKSFESDGAQIIVGIIKKSYLLEDYSKVIKVWEVFNKRYTQKVAKNPYLQFMVADSFSKLGLIKSFNKVKSELEKVSEIKKFTFPKWVEVHKNLSITDYLKELRLLDALKREDWIELDKILSKEESKNINYNFYKGLVSYHQKKYTKSVKDFEKFLTQSSDKNLLGPNLSITMLRTYLEALFESSKASVFRKKALAVVNDLRKNKSRVARGAIERINYLVVESINSESLIDYNNLIARSSEFLEEFKSSTYTDRVKLLNAIGHIGMSDVKKAQGILNNLVNGKDVPEYIKGLARSELSSLVLESKKL